MDTESVSKRTVNKHRQVICSVLEHAVRQPQRFGITENVARATRSAILRRARYAGVREESPGGFPHGFRGSLNRSGERKNSETGRVVGV
jgi:hypothetical protein